MLLFWHVVVPSFHSVLIKKKNYNIFTILSSILIAVYELFCVCDVYLSRPKTQISLIIASIIGVIAYRLAVFAAFASIMKDSPTNKLDVVGSLITPQFATSVTASCINFVIIMILNFLYERVAIKITDMGESFLTSNL